MIERKGIMAKRNGGKKRGSLFLLFGAAAGMLAFALTRRSLARRSWSTPGERGDGRAVAVVTGASSGIGAAYARLLASYGYNLALVGRRGERLQALADELQKIYKVKAEAVIADLSDLNEIERVGQYIAQIPDLEVLVNNAGFGATGHFTTLDPTIPVEMTHVHDVAMVRLSRAALPSLLKRKHGAIVNVASVAAFAPLAGDATYAATKSYMVTFSEALAAELRGTGVRVQALCPGFTVTEFHRRPLMKGFERRWIPKFMWMSADDVVRSSFHALRNGQVVHVPGPFYKLASIVLRAPLISPLIQEFASVAVNRQT
jgi:short-subunit dehydrogenase